MTQTSWGGEFQKVVSLATRNHHSTIHLLTFVHPLAGRQLPAGSVEIGETPHDAAIREMIEETGVNVCSGCKHLRTEVTELATTGVIQQAVEGVSRGAMVEIAGETDATVRIASRTYDYNTSPPVVLSEILTVIPKRLLARKLVRSFYHITVPNDGRMAWDCSADGHVFRVEWVPLAPTPKLTASQQLWLDRSLGDIS